MHNILRNIEFKILIMYSNMSRMFTLKLRVNKLKGESDIGILRVIPNIEKYNNKSLNKISKIHDYVLASFRNIFII